MKIKQTSWKKKSDGIMSQIQRINKTLLLKYLYHSGLKQTSKPFACKKKNTWYIKYTQSQKAGILYDWELKLYMWRICELKANELCFLACLIIIICPSKRISRILFDPVHPFASSSISTILVSAFRCSKGPVKACKSWNAWE